MVKRGQGAESALIGFSWLAALFVPTVLCAMVGFLVVRAWPSWGAPLFFGDTPALAALTGRAPVFDGIWPACVGTLSLIGLASLIAIPLGVATGVFLAEYAGRRTRMAFSLAVDLLAGVPSIVVGLFGFALILLLRRTFAPDANTGLLLSALCLAVLALPYLINATRLTLETLPAGLRLAGFGLGLTRWQVVSRLLLPASLRGVSGGVVLAVARAAEDTAAILLTGVVANAGMPGSLTGKYEALPFHIYYLAAEYQTPAELAQAFGSALVLLCLTGTLFVVARVFQRRLHRTWSGMEVAAWR
ncbi:PstA family ABC transporter permease [Propionivibrio soli]|uniref:PstA family ABC transporter permease n=1 Tax=Propionivibrio soli TaxID=2976531 RepID=UPI0021E91F98|nr:ABC transporter permease subunit [Propionivibrio soli]